MKTNNTNDFSKRTASKIASILIANGVAFKPESLGDGRTFYVNDASTKTRLGVIKAGFILDLTESDEKSLTFRAY